MKITRVLFPTDFSDCANAALPEAIQLAQRFDAELHMLHAIVLHEYDPFNPASIFPDPKDLDKALDKRFEEEMERLVKQHEAHSLSVRKVQRRGVAAAPSILDYATEADIDLIVMATHGHRGLGRFLLGSVTEEVVRQADCPVLTLRYDPNETPSLEVKRILVPVDFSTHSEHALTVARELGSRFDAELQLLHVVEQPVYPVFYDAVSTPVVTYSPELESESKTALEKLARETELPEGGYSVFVEKGTPADQILEHADEQLIDLIVIGTQGLTGLSHLLLGSVAEKVVRSSSCPVFTVKSEEGQEESGD